MDEMKRLVDRLNETAHAYYVLDDPIISDHEWDALYDRLVALEKETGIVLPDSPTRRVGGEPLSAFESHRHINRLWSLDKVQSKEELAAWFKRCAVLAAKAGVEAPLCYAVEHKLDGLSLCLTYREGRLVQAATRGNGEVGEGVLSQASTIQDVPLSIPYQGLLEVHGECIMRLSVLKDYNQRHQEKLKNARNAAAGALRNLDPKVTRERRLSAFFYSVNTIDNPPYADEEGMLSFLKENGFPVCPSYRQGAEEGQVARFVDMVEEERHTLDYMTDGAVIKITDFAARQAFGYTDKFPRWAVAYKFEAEETITTLEKVTWEVGRTGKLTPLGHVTPVEFSGVTVKKATLNNLDDIRRKNLSLGATVWIRRSNDVIPEITGHVEDGIAGAQIVPPESCPSCHGALAQVGAHIFCLNRESCREQVVARLAHFASRNAMDIAAFSEKTAGLLYDKAGVRTPGDLYALSRDTLLALEGFKDKKADNLLAALQSSRHCALDAFLFAVGIPGIGRVTARDLAVRFGSLDRVRAATREELLQVDDIGGIAADSIIDFFSDPYTLSVIEGLLQNGVAPRPVEVRRPGGALDGMTVVVTGTLPTLSRQQAEALIRAHGGTASGSVSRKTSYLLLGENAGGKLDKAQELNIPILDEAAFLRLIEQQ